MKCKYLRGIWDAADAAAATAAIMATIVVITTFFLKQIKRIHFDIYDHTQALFTTRSPAAVEGPRDTLCHLKSCKKCCTTGPEIVTYGKLCLQPVSDSPRYSSH